MMLEATIIASSIGELLPLLGQSALFGAASLTEPVIYDQAGESERATVRMKLRPVAKAVGSAPVGGSRG
jgi:hypothetical protein